MYNIFSLKTKYRVSFKIHVYMLLSIDCLKLNESQDPFLCKKNIQTHYTDSISNDLQDLKTSVD